MRNDAYDCEFCTCAWGDIIMGCKLGVNSATVHSTLMWKTWQILNNYEAHLCKLEMLIQLLFHMVVRV